MSELPKHRLANRFIDTRDGWFNVPKNRRKNGVTLCKLCGEKTYSDKAYCPAHVEHMPYAARLMAELAQTDDEIKQAEQLGSFHHIDPYGTIAQDVLNWVAWGSPTEHPTHVFGLSSIALGNYMLALVKAGLIHLQKPPRARHKEVRRICLTRRGAQVTGLNRTKLLHEEAVISVTGSST